MRFYSLAERNLKEIYRDPVSISLGLGMPVVLLILFASIQTNVRLDIFSPQILTPGIIIFCYAFLMMFVSVLLARDRQSSFLVRLFSTPLKSSDYILAYLMPFFPVAFIQAVICLIVGWLLGASYSNIFTAMIFFMLCSVMFISFGIIIGSLFTVNQTSGVGSIFITMVGLFGGGWMDLKMVGGVFETIGYVLPFAHAVDVSRGIISGAGFAAISHGLYIVSGYTLISFVLSVLSFRRAMKKV